MYITKTQDSSEKCFVLSATSGPQGAKSAKNGHFPPFLPVFTTFCPLETGCGIYYQQLQKKTLSGDLMVTGRAFNIEIAPHLMPVIHK